jgi:DNA-binding beta-propeller fold protein YncE
MRSLTKLLLATASIVTVAAAQAASSPDIKLTPLGRYSEEVRPGVCRTGIAQIGAYDVHSRRIFVTNSADGAVDILDVNDPAHLTLVSRITVASLTGSTNFEPTGVASASGLIALAVEAIDPVSANGQILLLDHDGKLLRACDVGSGPERLSFTPDGQAIVVAVQGEKDEANAIDPRGGVAIIDLRHGVQQAKSRFADFAGFNSKVLAASGVRIGPNPSDPDKLQPAVRDLEPHFIAVSPDSRTAWATLQLNNAVAIVDIRAARITAVLPFGLKNHNRPGSGLDASSDDGKVNIRPWPIRGAYMPDGIAAFAAHGRTFLATANEGDTRDDAIEVGDASVTLDPAVFPDAAALKDPTRLGGLEVSTLRQDARPNPKGEYRRLLSFGARSISLWSTSAQRLYDSGDQLEQITADPALYPAGINFFNTTDDENSFDKRSPRRGPQPLGIAIGRVEGRTYAFVGLEKQGGIIFADVTNAQSWVPLGYASTRNFAEDPTSGGTLDTHVEVNCAAGDLAPEGMLFIPAKLSPNTRPLLVVNYDTSGSTRILEVDPIPPH